MTSLAIKHQDLPEAEVKDFFALMKPGVMLLVLWAGLAGLLLAPEPLPLALMIAALLFMALGSGGAAALNMWYERKLDGLMLRTKNRPLPAGRISAGEALGFGASLSVASVAGMGIFVNLLAAALLLATIVFYVVVYTMWLKPNTVQNIVIGGAAGAAPPLIGWAAATESLALMPLWLFLIIFIWTPPHFWPLALRRKDEYEKAGLPMMPSKIGASATANQILFYTTALVFVSLLPLFSGASIFYGVIAFLLGAEFFRRALNLRLNIGGKKEETSAKKLFFYSMIYLFVLFGVLMVDNVIGRFYGGV